MKNGVSYKKNKWPTKINLNSNKDIHKTRYSIDGHILQN